MALSLCQHHTTATLCYSLSAFIGHYHTALPSLSHLSHSHHHHLFFNITFIDLFVLLYMCFILKEHTVSFVSLYTFATPMSHKHPHTSLLSFSTAVSSSISLTCLSSTDRPGCQWRTVLSPWLCCKYLICTAAWAVLNENSPLCATNLCVGIKPACFSCLIVQSDVRLYVRYLLYCVPVSRASLKPLKIEG